MIGLPQLGWLNWTAWGGWLTLPWIKGLPFLGFDASSTYVGWCMRTSLCWVIDPPMVEWLPLLIECLNHIGLDDWPTLGGQIDPSWKGRLTHPWRADWPSMGGLIDPLWEGWLTHRLTVLGRADGDFSGQSLEEGQSFSFLSLSTGWSRLFSSVLFTQNDVYPDCLLKCSLDLEVASSGSHKWLVVLHPKVGHYQLRDRTHSASRKCWTKYSGRFLCWGDFLHRVTGSWQF